MASGGERLSGTGETHTFDLVDAVAQFEKELNHGQAPHDYTWPDTLKNYRQLMVEEGAPADELLDMDRLIKEAEEKKAHVIQAYWQSQNARLS